MSPGDSPMPTLKPLLLLFAVSMLAGGLQTFRRLVTLRRTGLTYQALREWMEEPLSTWRYEPYISAAVLIHILAILVLCVAVLSAATKPAAFNDPLLLSDRTMVILDWIAEGGSMMLVGYLAGSLVAFPFASFRRAPITAAITAEGMVHGHSLLPWRWFSHFSIDFNTGLLRLYSAFSPDLPNLISKPPVLTPLAEIEDTLQEYLPGQPATAGRAWYQTKYFVIPMMILVCLPLVAAGWFAASLPRTLALFANAVIASVLALAGGRLITLFGFGVLKIGKA
jgi:hypothetical protein